MWTFGICYATDAYVSAIVNSIKNQHGIENKLEIILIGPRLKTIDSLQDSATRVIVFEDIVPGWITMKKNLIAQNASNENICFLHDYVALCEGWFDGYEQFGYDWDVCMNPVRMSNGLRHRDWFTQHRPLQFLDYRDNTRTREMYVNGAYWCAKTKFMLENPLDYRRVWGQGEDLEWASRCQNRWNYRLNPSSVVRYLKDKPESDWNPHPSIDPNKNMPYNECKVQQ